MLKVRVINRMKVPDITLQEDLEAVARDIILPNIRRNIDLRIAVTGEGLARNDEKTIFRKGHDRPLIDTGKLISSMFYKKQGKSKVLISISGDRKTIGGYLQGGIYTKSGIKQYLFFGISKDAQDGAMDYIRQRLKEALKNASQPSRKG